MTASLALVGITERNDRSMRTEAVRRGLEVGSPRPIRVIGDGGLDRHADPATYSRDGVPARRCRTDCSAERSE